MGDIEWAGTSSTKAAKAWLLEMRKRRMGVRQDFLPLTWVEQVESLAAEFRKAKAEQRAHDAAICRHRAAIQAERHKAEGSELALQRMTEANGCAADIERADNDAE